MKRSLLDMTLPELVEAVKAAGGQSYRAKQLADWIYRKGVTDAAKMTNLPAELAGQFDILTSRVAARADSGDGTVKLLLEFPDGGRVETVLIPTRQRATACVSTQIGCAMGCSFCATGLDGFQRNLRPGEILEQVLHLRQAGGRAITHVVFMGMGEPLANYDATVAAVRALIDPDRFGISARSVTVSTVGLPKQIRRLAAEDLPITLAISLHAPNDALRQQLVPAASKHSIKDILDAAADFYEARKREVTLEYVLLGGVNDSALCADALAHIARDLRCTVNVIPYDPVHGLGEAAGAATFSRPTAEAAEAFAQRVGHGGVRAHVRRPRGLDVTAACGQLRRRHAQGREEPH